MAEASIIIPFIKRWEGGLSKDPKDTASKNPAPCSYNGVVGYHTNKGITYTTFTTLAKPLKYVDSCDNFFAMPDDIFLKIFKNGYWQFFDLDNYKSQQIANLIVSWCWASGNYGAYKQIKKFLETNYKIVFTQSHSQNIELIKNFFNSLPGTDENKIYNKLVQYYKDYYTSLNQPTFIHGWLNRVNDLVDFSGIVTTVKKNPLKTIALLGITTAIIYKVAK